MTSHAVQDATPRAPVPVPPPEGPRSVPGGVRIPAGAAPSLSTTTTGSDSPALPYRAILCCGFDADSYDRPARGAPVVTTPP